VLTLPNGRGRTICYLDALPRRGRSVAFFHLTITLERRPHSSSDILASVPYCFESIAEGTWSITATMKADHERATPYNVAVQGSKLLFRTG
jgi:hypothetical protein